MQRVGGAAIAMTICVGVKVNDCIVFVADSASSIMAHTNGGPRIHRVYNHGDKVFNLFRGLPIVAMTCGLGAFGRESISTIAKGIRVELMSGGSGITPENYSVEHITRFTHERFHAKFQALDPIVQQASSFEFFVGGYSAGAADSEIWKFQFAPGQDSAPVCISPRDHTGLIWSGQPEACVRLVFGMSSNLPAILKGTGLTDDQVDNLIQLIQQRSLADLVEPAMPVRDAIDLGRFLAQTASSYVKFLPGADVVGGELDIATVTRYEGFRWINRKHFYSPALNPETDHVR